VGDFNYYIILYYAIKDINNSTFKSPFNDPIFRDIYLRVVLLRNFLALYNKVDLVFNNSNNTKLKA
jgi:hypothetical protein